jgi:hypothetical protein
VYSRVNKSPHILSLFVNWWYQNLTMPLKTILCICLIVIASIIGGQLYAQKIELTNLAKIELITAGSWMDGYYQKVEVVFENGAWKSYQTRLASNGNSRGRQIANDSTRTFIKDIPASTVTQFIKLATTPDPIIKDELFNLKTSDLMTQIDSLLAEEERFNRNRLFPSAEWKGQFIKAVSTKSVVSKALFNVLHPLPMDDRSHYYIITTDKFNKTDTVTADANNELYYLPWMIGGKPSYNPNITKLFELMRGNYTFSDKEQKRLNYQILGDLYYYKAFKAKLDWDRFKAEQPELYNQASKTLTPFKFSRYNEGASTYDMGYTGVFLSTHLPAYIELSCSFAKAYPNLIGFSNALESRVTAWYKKGSFLFDFMKRHPNATMYFSPSIQNELYTAMEKRYPALAKIDIEKIRIFSIAGNKDYPNSSLWMLLPDNKLILMKYGGNLSDNYQTKFDIIPAKRRGLPFTNVCIVFDKYGKKIGGSEESFEVKRKEL